MEHLQLHFKSATLYKILLSTIVLGNSGI